jgi:hypothetical protein
MTSAPSRADLLPKGADASSAKDVADTNVSTGVEDRWTAGAVNSSVDGAAIGGAFNGSERLGSKSSSAKDVADITTSAEVRGSTAGAVNSGVGAAAIGGAIEPTDRAVLKADRESTWASGIAVGGSLTLFVELSERSCNVGGAMEGFVAEGSGASKKGDSCNGDCKSTAIDCSVGRNTVGSSTVSDRDPNGFINMGCSSDCPNGNDGRKGCWIPRGFSPGAKENVVDESGAVMGNT